MQGINIAVQKDATNPTLVKGELLIDDLVIHGWKDPNAAVFSRGSRSLSEAMRVSSVDGKSLRFAVPSAYRNVSGAVAAIDLSGKIVAKAAFVKGQENVSMNLAGHQAATVFLRVLTGAEAL